MHLQQIHPKVLVYLLEFSGNAGVMCQTSEMFECPRFNTAMFLFLKLPTNELRTKRKSQGIRLFGATFVYEGKRKRK